MGKLRLCWAIAKIGLIFIGVLILYGGFVELYRFVFVDVIEVSSVEELESIKSGYFRLESEVVHSGYHKMGNNGNIVSHIYFVFLDDKQVVISSSEELPAGITEVIGFTVHRNEVAPWIYEKEAQRLGVTVEDIQNQFSYRDTTYHGEKRYTDFLMLFGVGIAMIGLGSLMIFIENKVKQRMRMSAPGYY